MIILQRTVNRIKEEFEKQGNGAIIHHKNGKTYELWAQETGTYQITDKLTIWQEETFCKTVPTVTDLAKVILNL